MQIWAIGFMLHAMPPRGQICPEKREFRKMMRGHLDAEIRKKLHRLEKLLKAKLHLSDYGAAVVIFLVQRYIL